MEIGTEAIATIRPLTILTGKGYVYAVLLTSAFESTSKVGVKIRGPYLLTAPQFENRRRKQAVLGRAMECLDVAHR